MDGRGDKAEATRARILDAAAAEFRKSGFAETRLVDIAAAADTRAGNFYYHFSSGEEIVGEVLASALSHIDAAITARLAALGSDASPMERLNELTRVYLEMLLGDDDYTAAYARIIRAVPEHIRATLIPRITAFDALAQDTVDAVARAGQTHPGLDITVARQLMFGALDATADWYRVRASGLSVAGLHATFARIYFEGLATDPDQLGRAIASVHIREPDIRPDASANPVTRADATKRRILVAAAKVLGRHGYTNAKLSEIAAEANIQTGSLYYHFSSRDALVSGLLEVSSERIHNFVRANVAALPPDASPIDRFATMVTAHLVSALADEYTPAMNRLTAEVPAHLLVDSRTSQRRYASEWARVLRELARSGAIRSDVDVSVTSRLLFGAMNRATEWYSPVSSPPVTAVAAQFLELTLTGLVSADERDELGSLAR